MALGSRLSEEFEWGLYEHLLFMPPCGRAGRSRVVLPACCKMPKSKKVESHCPMNVEL
jgi:hypothetical protein